MEDYALVFNYLLHESKVGVLFENKRTRVATTFCIFFRILKNLIYVRIDVYGLSVVDPITFNLDPDT